MGEAQPQKSIDRLLLIRLISLSATVMTASKGMSTDRLQQDPMQTNLEMSSFLGDSANNMHHDLESHPLPWNGHN